MAEPSQQARPLFGDGLVALDGRLFVAELTVEARDQPGTAQRDGVGVGGRCLRGAPAGDPGKRGNAVVPAGRVLAKIDLDPLDG